MRVYSSSKSGSLRPLLLPALMASSMLTAVTPAMAQIETVVVTAEKRTEDVQTVPIAITVLGDKRLQELQVTHFDDYAKFLPSVDFQTSGPGFANVYIRGVASGENNNHSGPLPSVGIYLDEQPVTTINGALDIHVYDIARVEELSGPQGTLYGASSESGTIRIITNKPDPSGFSGSVSLEGNTVAHGGEGYVAEGYVNVPLSDNAAIRLVVWDQHDAGYIDNIAGTNLAAGIVNGVRVFQNATELQGVVISSNNAAERKNNINSVDTMGGRLALKIDLDDNWTITPTIMGQRADANGIFAYDRGMGFLKYAHALPEYSDDSWYQAALTIEGKIGNFDLTYAGAYMDRWVKSSLDYADYSFFYDAYGNYYSHLPGSLYHDLYSARDGGGNYIDPSQWILGHDQFTKRSNELRISSPQDQRLRFIAGVFEERQWHSIEQRYVVPNGELFIVDFGVPAGPVTGWPNTIWLTEQQRVDRDFAVFGEATYDISPTLKFTFGGRGYIANNSLYGFLGYSDREALCIPGKTPYRDGPCVNLDKTTYEKGATHKLNLSWQVDDDKMLYATYSTGFRPGGVNRKVGAGPYKSDFLSNYELGWKTAWADNTVIFNGALFYEDWHGIQFTTIPPHSSGLTQVFNAGKARIWGIESSLNWAVTDDLNLTAAAAYTDAQLTQDYCVKATPCDGIVPVDAFAGTELPVTPKFRGNAIARYNFDVGEHKAHIQGAAIYHGSFWPGLILSDRADTGKIPAYTTADFTAGIDFDKFTIELGVTNAFDTHGENDRYVECTICSAQVYSVPITPRVISIRLGKAF